MTPINTMNWPRIRKRASRVFIYISALLIVALIIFPLFTLFRASVMPKYDLWHRPTVWMPKDLQWKNYIEVVQATYLVPVNKAIINSTIIATVSATLSTLIGSLAGYAFARLRFRRKNTILSALMGFYLAPGILFLLPMFVMFRTLGLIDTFPGLIIPYTIWPLPFVAMIMRTFFSKLPPEIEEAALVDGCSRLQLLRHIVMPLAAPGLAAGFICQFIGAWNEFMTPLILASKMKVVTTVIGMFTSSHELKIGHMAAAGVYTILPVLVMTLVFQRQIEQGLVEGAVK